MLPRQSLFISVQLTCRPDGLLFPPGSKAEVEEGGLLLASRCSPAEQIKDRVQGVVIGDPGSSFCSIIYECVRGSAAEAKLELGQAPPTDMLLHRRCALTI